MKKRAITSVIITIATVALALISHYIVYPIVVSVLAAIAVYELFKVIGVSDKLYISLPAYLFAAVYPVASFFVTPDTKTKFILALGATLFVYLLYTMGVAVFSKGKILISCQQSSCLYSNAAFIA